MITNDKIQLWLDMILFEQEIIKLQNEINKTIHEAEQKRKELFDV